VARIAVAGGYVLYLRQEGRGIGLYDKLDAYALQDRGLDTYDANVALGHDPDERDYTVAAQMLRALDVTRIALLSNNPDKSRQLLDCGIEIAEQVPTGVYVSDANVRYLSAKTDRGGHLLRHFDGHDPLYADAADGDGNGANGWPRSAPTGTQRTV
jgi:GTP cyclohydrolase II